MPAFDIEVKRRVETVARTLAELARLASREMVERALTVQPIPEAPRRRRLKRLPKELERLLRQLDGKQRPSLPQVRREFERLYVERELRRANGNVTHAARALGVTRQELQRKLQRYKANRRSRRH